MLHTEFWKYHQILNAGSYHAHFDSVLGQSDHVTCCHLPLCSLRKVHCRVNVDYSIIEQNLKNQTTDFSFGPSLVQGIFGKKLTKASCLQSHFVHTVQMILHLICTDGFYLAKKSTQTLFYIPTLVNAAMKCAKICQIDI